MTRRFKKGDRVRLKVRTIFGWKGTGTVARDSLGRNTVEFWKDGEPRDEHGIPALACPHELAKIRKPTDRAIGARRKKR